MTARAFITIPFVLAGLATPALAQAATPGVAVTQIHALGKTSTGTGDSAAPPINAQVVTVDNGVSINSTGVGTGFQTQGLYVSVLYENGSKPTGSKACLPAGNVNFGDRIIGAWVPDGSTTRVLAPVTEIGQAYTGANGKQGGQLQGVWNRGTISVRMVNLIKPPYLYANLQACGQVSTTPTATAAASTLFGTSLSSVFGLTAGKPAMPTLASVKQMTNPLAPTLPIGGTVASVLGSVTGGGASGGGGGGGTVTITKTVPVPEPTRTVSGPTVTVTKTVSAPTVTVTVPKVTTITTPGVTVTVPGLQARP